MSRGSKTTCFARSRSLLLLLLRRQPERAACTVAKEADVLLSLGSGRVPGAECARRSGGVALSKDHEMCATGSASAVAAMPWEQRSRQLSYGRWPHGRSTARI